MLDIFYVSIFGKFFVFGFRKSGDPVVFLYHYIAWASGSGRRSFLEFSASLLVMPKPDNEQLFIISMHATNRKFYWYWYSYRGGGLYCKSHHRIFLKFIYFAKKETQLNIVRPPALITTIYT